MSDTEYRRYSTAELAAMAHTARLQDAHGNEWHPCMFTGRRNYYWLTLVEGDPVSITPSRLARRKLRRIA